MPWKKNKKLLAEGFQDLAYLPRERGGWDFTLASLAYGVRRHIEQAAPDLNAWAARHCLPASGRYGQLGPAALVLWHGTSRQRAEKIAEHGLFHKGGLWTTVNPTIAHGYTRGRSERFGIEGAMVCIVLDRDSLVDGRDCTVEGAGDIVRFHHGLGPEAVQYVLLHEEIRFTGEGRARRPSPWPRAKFKRAGGRWVPVQKPPVRYSPAAAYSSLDEFARACLDRLLGELGEAAALEVFSALYAAIEPADALAHEEVLELIESCCVPARRKGKWQTFRKGRASPGP